MIHDTQSAQISQKQDGRNIYVTMKTMCPPGYHCNGSVATHALGHMMYHYTLLVPMNQTIRLLALPVEHSLVHWYQQCVTVNHVPKCMSCHKAIVVTFQKGVDFSNFSKTPKSGVCIFHIKRKGLVK